MGPLDLDIVKKIHQDAIDKGPTEERSLRDTVRDEGTLQFIVERSNDICDPVEKAVFILHRIATQHPFMEGNKRTAWATAMCILDMNGQFIEETDELADVFVRKVASNIFEEKEILDWFNEHIESFTE